MREKKIKEELFSFIYLCGKVRGKKPYQYSFVVVVHIIEECRQVVKATYMLKEIKCSSIHLVESDHFPLMRYEE